MAAGIHVMIEKPIAPTVEDALALEKMAADRGVILMVGHVERFNPVVLELEHIVDQPIHLDILSTCADSLPIELTGPIFESRRTRRAVP